MVTLQWHYRESQEIAKVITIHILCIILISVSFFIVSFWTKAADRLSDIAIARAKSHAVNS